MPIYLDDTKAIVVHFGYGDVIIGHGRNPNNDVIDELVIFDATLDKEPGVIGQSCSGIAEYTTPYLRLVFDKLESLEIVIDQLDFIRKQMVNR